MMTSRSEYRLMLRQDNADERLTPIGYRVGLISEERYQKFLKKQELVAEEIKRLQKTVVVPRVANPFFEKYGSSAISTGIHMSDIIKRPEMNYEIMAEIDPERPELSHDVTEQAEIKLKYEGYIEKQKIQINQFKKLENKKLPEDIDYDDIYGLRIEARQKLSKIRPLSLGQASRISGVSPADISVLVIWLESKGKEQ